MTDALETRLTVRVQARGGKFLGDDIGGAVVTIRDAQTGELFATGTTAGGSGSLTPSSSPAPKSRIRQGAIGAPSGRPRCGIPGDLRRVPAISALAEMICNFRVGDSARSLESVLR